MIDNYTENIRNIISTGLFYTFIICLCVITITVVISLVMLTVGCLLKSQTIRSKFIKVAPISIILLIFVLFIPKIYIMIIRNF